MNTPDAPPTPLLPFQLDPEPATETLTAFGGLPLVAQTYRSLGLPQRAWPGICDSSNASAAWTRPR